uniref:Uncharacterized protein n=1 Tax=Lotharella oceanica TaxID=641309 RepID=A0A7S2U5P7_9EUKA|mmetsp:Transcript_8700/g.17060  ORF Transcript_8700/g.17060 Transcript_8700/m.17060 type:complete len:237 (+) Transcript_8700:77-787(+)
MGNGLRRGSTHIRSGTWFQGMRFHGTLDSNGSNKRGKVKFCVDLVGKTFELTSSCRETTWYCYDYSAAGRDVSYVDSTVVLSGHLDMGMAFEEKAGFFNIPMDCAITKAVVSNRKGEKSSLIRISVVTKEEFGKLLMELSRGSRNIVPELHNVVLDYLGADYLMSVGKIRREFADSTLRFGLLYMVRHRRKRKGAPPPTTIPVPKSGEQFVESIKKRLHDPKPSPLQLFPRRVLTY